MAGEAWRLKPLIFVFPIQDARRQLSCKDSAVGSVPVLGGQPGSRLGCLAPLQSTAGSVRLFCPSGSGVPKQHPEKK